MRDEARIILNNVLQDSSSAQPQAEASTLHFVLIATLFRR